MILDAQTLTPYGEEIYQSRNEAGDQLDDIEYGDYIIAELIVNKKYKIVKTTEYKEV